MTVSSERVTTGPDTVSTRFHPRALHLSNSGLEVVDHALGNPEGVAQVDKQQIAVVAFAMNPARETHGLAGVGVAQLAAIV